jgi:hypothetical protein
VPVLLKIPGLFDLFEESEEDLFWDQNLKVTKTPVSCWYEASADDFETSIKCDNDGWVMWEVEGSKLLVQPRNPAIDGVLLLFGFLGFWVLLLFWFQGDSTFFFMSFMAWKY